MTSRLLTGKHQLIVLGLLLSIFLLGMALRLYQLDADSFWSDEIITARTSQLSIPSILQHQSEWALNPPLTFIVTHFFFAWDGESEFGARLPAALFGSLSILLIYGVGKTLWTRREGTIAAFLLAVSAHHVQYSQEARHYALMLFLALLSVLFLLKALQKNEMRLWMGFVLCTSLGLYNHYFAFLLLPAEVIFGAWVTAEKWLSYRKENTHGPQIGTPTRFSSPAKQALLFSLSLILVGMSYLPWVSTLEAQVAQQVQPGAAGISIASLQLSLSLLSQVPAAYGGGGGIPALVWLTVLLLGLTACDSKRIALTLLWMGTPFAFLGIVGVKHALHLRYILFALPVYLLVAARGITSTILVDRLLQRTQRGRTWPVTVVPALCVLILGAASALSTKAYYLQEKEDWRGAARYLADHMAPEDIIVADGIRYRAGGDAWRVSEALSYYLGSYGAARTSILPVGRQLWQGLQRPRQWDGDVWGVLWHPGRLPPADMVTVVDFHKVSIIRLRQASGDAVRDTLSMLQAVLDCLPMGEARFDVHLARAEIYLRSGRFEEARLELEKARDVRPGTPEARRDLAETRTDLEQLSYAEGEDIQHPLWRSLGEVIAFLGYNIGQGDLRAGQPLRITLWWQPTDYMDKDYTAFLHVVSEDGRIWAQQDILLHYGDGDFPTSIWLVGGRVGQEYELELASDIPFGEYVVKVGIYYWETGERLAVWDETGERLPDDAISLGSITVHD